MGAVSQICDLDSTARTAPAMDILTLGAGRQRNRPKTRVIGFNIKKSLPATWLRQLAAKKAPSCWMELFFLM